MEHVDSFRPAFYLRNPYLQTYLASSRWRMARIPRLSWASPEVVITTPNEHVRLLAKLSVHENPSAGSKGLTVLIHGWEGSADSAYMLSTGSYLYAHGYDVLRLNLRDHGNSHHLNQGLFYASLLDEVFEAIQVSASTYARGPVFLVGFSLGGNFALRVGLKLSSSAIAGLRHIVCISPVLNPERSTTSIDSNPALRRYFIRKWFTSLQKKQHLFPKLYRFDDVFNLNTCLAITHRLLSRYSSFESVQQYFKSYTIFENDLKDINLPLTIITAKDDPIIPFSDFNQLALSDSVTLISPQFGGHNGFIQNLNYSCWYEKKMLTLFDGAHNQHLTSDVSAVQGV
jgi:predicted alpha/beta-fold hydrolase